MKALVFFLALMATAKVGYHEYMFRTASNEVIVAAYRERAVNACQRDARGLTLAPTQAWIRPESVKLRIGKNNLDVYVWQFDHKLWNARFKNPYLFLTAGERTQRTYCEFDIVHGTASVFRL